MGFVFRRRQTSVSVSEQAATRSLGGLFYVHSHGQQREAFENHARVLQLSSAYPAVAGASLLIANNNRSLPAQLLEQWVRSQSVRYPMTSVLLLHLARNAGFQCGEFQSLNATQWLWQLFPWVLYTSGLDNWPTPDP